MEKVQITTVPCFLFVFFGYLFVFAFFFISKEDAEKLV